MKLGLKLAIAALSVIVALAVLAPVLPMDVPTQMNLGGRLKGPSVSHWLGQDQFGRDVLSRLIWGARASIFVAAAAALLAAIIGTALGVIGGFLRGAAEQITMRAMDLLLCFPPLLLAMLVVTLTGPGTLTLIPVLVLVFIPGFARIAYSNTLSVRNREYVEAAHSLGATKSGIMLRTILPNIAGPVLVQLSLTLAAAMVLESGLSFLGLGVVPPTPSWGLMISEARASISQAPLLVVWPCLALSGIILLLNTVCDQLRDLLDPGASARLVRRKPRPRVQNKAAAKVPAEAMVAIRDLDISLAGSAPNRLELVRGMDLEIRRGETLALVGESGSGKSLTSLAIMGLLPEQLEVTRGSITVDGVEVTSASEAELSQMRGRKMAMIFQDPAASLNPVYRVGDQIAETLTAAGEKDVAAKVLNLLQRVGIPDPARRAKAYPHEMSGGMRQRAMIAAAIANRPGLIIADEPTTALDVTIQAQILDLLEDLVRETGASMLFISHSLPVVGQIADRVAVMYAGEIVESGPVAEVFASPRHPYTRALIAAVPEAGHEPQEIPGTVPPAGKRPAGCAFFPRCAVAAASCAELRPSLETDDDRQVRCHLWRSL